MTIKKRLAVSNVLMILVPVIITLLIAAGCVGVIWFQVTHSVGLAFEDNESFAEASAGISELAAEALEKREQDDRLKALGALSSFLDRSSLSLVVTADGEEIYRYGTESGSNAQLVTAAAALGNEGILSSGTNYLNAHALNSGGTDYVIYLSGTQCEPSYANLEITTGIAGGVLLLTILFSIFFTDRFLIRFVFRRIEQPLDMLSSGVRQISEGNLAYRLEYSGKDEFLPVCRAFNEMAQRLSESVERSRKDEESRKELMAGISHDLRSPLTSIQAYVEGLLDGVAKTPEAQRKYLTTIKERAEELEGMVERVLAFSRLELDNAAAERPMCRLDDAISQVLQELAVDYSLRGLDITARLEPFTAPVNQDELRQLIVNIADNSLKYKVEPRASLRIALTDQGGHGELSFADDGPGVPPETLGKLFDEFYRTDSARSDRAKGSGLGLSIVEKTVSRMGGRVRAENGMDGGLAIIIELPKGGAADAQDPDR